MSKEGDESQRKPPQNEELEGLADKSVLRSESAEGSTAYEDLWDCQTPSSSDHRISASRSCPVAPHKTGQRKRKRSESVPQFFETTRGDEVELFFQLDFELSGVIRSRDRKRRCKSI